MSLTAPPSPQQPSIPPFANHNHEPGRTWQQWPKISPLPLTFLLLLTAFLFYLSPLLPVVASLLWIWATSSWTWRDRWTSVWLWAKQGIVIVTTVLIIVLLGFAQVGIVAQFTTLLQTLWHAHVGGDLSLSPGDLNDLLARTLLLLPLAPALALAYEWLIPRTPVQLRRILTPADFLEKPRPSVSPATPTTPESGTPPSPPAAEDRKAQQPVAKARSTRKPTARKKHPPTQQVTIEGFLAPDQTQHVLSSPPSSSTSEPSPPRRQSTSINWDDVAE